MPNYVCPSCSGETSVAVEHVGGDVVCPHCQSAFYAQPEEAPAIPAKPIKIPFFRFSRRKALRNELRQLIADGEYSVADDERMGLLLAAFNLDQNELHSLRLGAFKERIDHIYERIYRTFHLTEEDEKEIEELGKKMQIKVEYDDTLRICKNIYSMEVLRLNPLSPIECADVFLKPNETVLFSIPTVWAQYKTQNRGYSGVSFSFPTGIRGVRFRLGSYKPIGSTELTPISQGNLYVSNKRIIFNGDQKSTSINSGRIIDIGVFSDALCIEKSAGKPDYFSMDALNAKYVSAIARFSYASS